VFLDNVAEIRSVEVTICVGEGGAGEAMICAAPWTCAMAAGSFRTDELEPCPLRAPPGSEEAGADDKEDDGRLIAGIARPDVRDTARSG
jgi:hypothetical protein